MAAETDRGTDLLVADLEAAIGSERVAVGGGARRLYSRDSSIIAGGRAGPVCFAESTDDVAACVRVVTITTGSLQGTAPPESPVPATSRW